MKVICCAGQKQNGKDTLADYLMPLLAKSLPDHFDGELDVWERGAFANAVKRVYCDTFDVDFDFIEEWKVKDDIPPGFDKDVRRSLQFIGDGFREIRGDIWIDLAFRNRRNSVVLSDGRYPNEIRTVYDRCGVNILVYRPGWLNDDPNGSESLIKPVVEWFLSNGEEGDNWNKDRDDWDDIPELVRKVHLFIRNDGTIEDLYNKVEEIVLPYIVNYYTKGNHGERTCRSTEQEVCS